MFPIVYRCSNCFQCCLQNETPMDLAIRSRSMWLIQKLKAVSAGKGIDKSASLWSWMKNNQVGICSEFSFHCIFVIVDLKIIGYNRNAAVYFANSWSERCIECFLTPLDERCLCRCSGLWRTSFTVKLQLLAADIVHDVVNDVVKPFACW